MHTVSGPLRRAAIEYLKRRQAQSNPPATDTEMARKLGVGQSTWTQMRQGERGIGIEVLCRAIKAYPGLLTEVISFLGTLVSETHRLGADEHGEGEEVNGARERAGTR